MAHGLKQIPRTEFGDGFAVRTADLGSDLVLPAANVAQGSLSPDKVGVTMVNRTGSTITAGQLCYGSSWDAPAGMVAASLAAATAQTTRAQWVALASIANNATGAFGLHYSLTGQNTNAATVGDAAYLSATPGGYVLTTAPTQAIIQNVGRVAVKSATVGVIEFLLLPGVVPITFIRQQIAMPTIPTANLSVVSGRIICQAPGIAAGFRGVFKDGLIASDSNFVTADVVNLQSGAGTTVLTATSPAGVNTSKATGGQAIIAETAYTLTPSATPANLVVASGDILRLRFTVSGTLPNTLTEGVFSVAFIPT